MLTMHNYDEIPLGANSPTLGVASTGVFCFEVLYILLFMVESAKLHLSLSAPDGSSWKLFLGMWWSDVYAEHRGSDSGSNEERP